jgi:hypothetical protein
MFFSFKLLQFILKSRGLDGWKFSANDGLGMLFIILAYLETNPLSCQQDTTIGHRLSGTAFPMVFSVSGTHLICLFNIESRFAYRNNYQCVAEIAN